MTGDARVYNLTTTAPAVADEQRDAARRMVARQVADPAERAQVEDMLGLGL